MKHGTTSHRQVGFSSYFLDLVGIYHKLLGTRQILISWTAGANKLF
jgi:hypothetical protein